MNLPQDIPNRLAKQARPHHEGVEISFNLRCGCSFTPAEDIPTCAFHTLIGFVSGATVAMSRTDQAARSRGHGAEATLKRLAAWWVAGGAGSEIVLAEVEIRLLPIAGSSEGAATSLLDQGVVGGQNPDRVRDRVFAG